MRLWLDETPPPTEEDDAVDPIVFNDLTPDEQELVHTTLDGGEHTTDQDSVSPALEILRDRIEMRTGNGETLEVYLKRNDTYYRVGFADGDHIIAHPDH